MIVYRLFVIFSLFYAVLTEDTEVEVSRYNETTTAMSGAAKLLKGMEQNTLVEAYVEKDVSGRYELVMSHEICNICDELGKEESNYYSYIKDIELPDSCPFPPAEYNIKDLVIDTKYLPLNKANEGRYQMTLNFYDSPSGDCTGLKKFIACLKVDMVIEPK
ncbi:PREDICTED: uncharacterized protein LOC106116263 isoform X2 [Papilio xuthus]|uniref:Uncharacterized protein LOC106116263 isoform X2 n=1 Tax=Papilio xuthus TaxID=66420 RepID=A0AAJ6Z563_PAPXU|nr:PREDICTED: uncharacterized protein LOC106116263 isoform X2 [Papilio xuthus]